MELHRMTITERQQEILLDALADLDVDMYNVHGARIGPNELEVLEMQVEAAPEVFEAPDRIDETPPAVGDIVVLNRRGPKYLAGLYGTVRKVNAKSVKVDFPRRDAFRRFSGRPNVRVDRRLIGEVLKTAGGAS